MNRGRVHAFSASNDPYRIKKQILLESCAWICSVYFSDFCMELLLTFGVSSAFVPIVSRGVCVYPDLIWRGRIVLHSQVIAAFPPFRSETLKANSLLSSRERSTRTGAEDALSPYWLPRRSSTRVVRQHLASVMPNQNRFEVALNSSPRPLRRRDATKLCVRAGDLDKPRQRGPARNPTTCWTRRHATHRLSTRGRVLEAPFSSAITIFYTLSRYLFNHFQNNEC